MQQIQMTYDVYDLPPSQQMRQNRAALERLVRCVIRNELCEQDRLLVRLHWYQGKSKDEIAALCGIDRSTVHRRLERVNAILYDKLKYAVDYHFDAAAGSEARQTLCAVGRGTFTMEALDGIGERLRTARAQKKLSLQALSQATGISVSRLRELEQNGRAMMMTELGVLTGCLGVSVQTLLFGECGEGSGH